MIAWLCAALTEPSIVAGLVLLVLLWGRWLPWLATLVPWRER